ncbi:hypothetical protein IAG44_19355 [Streptomyces roseirectus]|uniref:Lipoprotein n=1 Tax=Streptomyces roseirectus TaxID=2768066 RepID=A0A7H0IST7_9ACTN|nr:hypothetical protein [Streptomyces roseirectus]QNP75853.1 hypothetical protein IAG44_19355 [Streptomyces roseirectus]
MTGCAALGLEHPAVAPHPTPTVEKSPSPKPSSTAPGVLSEAQAQAALLTVADLGAPWTATRGAATWRDGVLKSTSAVPECARFLDALYADELLGAPARAAVGLDDADTDAQLRFQVTAQRPAAEVDRALAWLKTIPQVCARFTATSPTNVLQDVTVTEAPLPAAGDARQGLHVTLTSYNEDGEPSTLTLDVAAVRAGDDAYTLVNGGLGDVANEATQIAVQLGALRLADVRKRGRVQV